MRHCYDLDDGRLELQGRESGRPAGRWHEFRYPAQLASERRAARWLPREGRCAGCGRENHHPRTARLRRARRPAATAPSIAKRPVGHDAWPRRARRPTTPRTAAAARHARPRRPPELPRGGPAAAGGYGGGRSAQRSSPDRDGLCDNARAPPPPPRCDEPSGRVPLARQARTFGQPTAQGAVRTARSGCALRSPWADARPDARRPLSAPGLSVARATAPAAAVSCPGRAGAAPGAPRLA